MLHRVFAELLWHHIIQLFPNVAKDCVQISLCALKEHLQSLFPVVQDSYKFHKTIRKIIILQMHSRLM